MRLRFAGVLLLLALGSPAWAAKGPIRFAVLPSVVAGPHGQASVSTIYASIAKATQLRADLSLIPNEEIYIRHERTANEVRECGADNACALQKLRAIDAGVVLVASVTLEFDPPLVSLQLFHIDDSKLLGEFVGSPADGQSIDALVEEQTNLLLEGAGYQRAGRLIVEIEPEGARRAQIVVGEGAPPDINAPNIFTLSPGHYEVRAELEGWSPDSGSATVESGKTARVSLTLIEEKSLIDSPWFWGGVGAAAIGAGVLVAVLAAPAGATCVCLTSQTLGIPCGCDAAQSQ